MGAGEDGGVKKERAMGRSGSIQTGQGQAKESRKLRDRWGRGWG